MIGATDENQAGDSSVTTVPFQLNPPLTEAQSYLSHPGGTLEIDDAGNVSGDWDERKPNKDGYIAYQKVDRGPFEVLVRAEGYEDAWVRGESAPHDDTIEVLMVPRKESGFLGTYQNPGNLLYCFTNNQNFWQMLGYTAHLLPVCVMRGEDIRPFIRRVRSYANTLVTVGTHLSPWKIANGWRFDPRTNEAKDALNRMFDIGAEEGIRFAHGVAADMQDLSDNDKRRIWNEQCDIMSGRWNLIARCGNESEVNGWHPDMFERRDLHGVLQSAGSVGLGQRPHQHYRDFSEWEGRRTPDSGWHKCLDDAGAGIFEQHVGYADQHSIPVPIVMIEGQFFADTDPDHVGDRRCTDPQKALQYGLQIGASCAGGAVGTSMGMEGKFDGPVAEACARQQLYGMKTAFHR